MKPSGLHDLYKNTSGLEGLTLSNMNLPLYIVIFRWDEAWLVLLCVVDYKRFLKLFARTDLFADFSIKFLHTAMCVLLLL